MTPRSHVDHTNASPTDECAQCLNDITRVSMARNGRDLEFVSCSTCETREWLCNGRPTDLDEVLDSMTATTSAPTPLLATNPISDFGTATDLSVEEKFTIRFVA